MDVFPIEQDSFLESIISLNPSNKIVLAGIYHDYLRVNKISTHLNGSQNIDFEKMGLVLDTVDGSYRVMYDGNIVDGLIIFPLMSYEEGPRFFGKYKNSISASIDSNNNSSFLAGTIFIGFDQINGKMFFAQNGNIEFMEDNYFKDYLDRSEQNYAINYQNMLYFTSLFDLEGGVVDILGSGITHAKEALLSYHRRDQIPSEEKVSNVNGASFDSLIIKTLSGKVFEIYPKFLTPQNLRTNARANDLSGLDVQEFELVNSKIGWDLGCFSVPLKENSAVEYNANLIFFMNESFVNPHWRVIVPLLERGVRSNLIINNGDFPEFRDNSIVDLTSINNFIGVDFKLKSLLPGIDNMLSDIEFDRNFLSANNIGFYSSDNGDKYFIFNVKNSLDFLVLKFKSVSDLIENLKAVEFDLREIKFENKSIYGVSAFLVKNTRFANSLENLISFSVVGEHLVFLTKKIEFINKNGDLNEDGNQEQVFYLNSLKMDILLNNAFKDNLGSVSYSEDQVFTTNLNPDLVQFKYDSPESFLPILENYSTNLTLGQNFRIVAENRNNRLGNPFSLVFEDRVVYQQGDIESAQSEGFDVSLVPKTQVIPFEIYSKGNITLDLSE